MPTLLNVGITTAVAAGLSPVFSIVEPGPATLLIQANFTYGTSGGTTTTAYVQTSVDGGATWIDIANFAFTTSSAIAIYNLSGGTVHTTAVTPTDGSLASNTCNDGILGHKYRVKYVVVGTYVGATTLQIDVATTRLHT